MSWGFRYNQNHYLLKRIYLNRKYNIFAIIFNQWECLSKLFKYSLDIPWRIRSCSGEKSIIQCLRPPQCARSRQFDSIVLLSWEYSASVFCFIIYSWMHYTMYFKLPSSQPLWAPSLVVASSKRRRTHREMSQPRR